MSKTYYLVGALKEKHPISILGNEVNLDLIFADGMIGCCPVFSNREDAESYGDGKYDIFPIVLK